MDEDVTISRRVGRFAIAKAGVEAQKRVPPNPVNPVEKETLWLCVSALRECFSNYRSTQRDFGGEYCSVLQYFLQAYCRTRQYLIQCRPTRRYCHA